MFYPIIAEKGTVLSPEAIRSGLHGAFADLGRRQRVLVIPPDITRLHSGAGAITREAYEYYQRSLVAILPALGTHFPMSQEERERMFGDIPMHLFVDHDWQQDTVTLGEVPSWFVREVSEGAVDFAWPAQVNRRLVEDDYDLILSVGQVVPHEVIGMANYTKNIFVGTGGAEGIHKSHYLGAVYGMERIMGRVDSPVRAVLNYAGEHFAQGLPIVYVLTVIGRDAHGVQGVRGLFIGNDHQCYRAAARLAAKENITVLDEPVDDVVVYLDPQEYRSTWIGNKAIYRTRMVVADGGTLTIIAPGVRTFGENNEIDAMIRRYGYRGTHRVQEVVRQGEPLANNLAAAAHLIHGSTEGRFTVRYATGGLSRQEVEGAGFEYTDVEAKLSLYQPRERDTGFYERSDGSHYFFVANPALGLWGTRSRFARR